MSISAMKQALEALVEIHPGNMTPMAEEAWNKAITALRQAIAEAEKQEPDDLTIAYMSGFHDGKKKREWVGLTEQDIHDAFQFTELVKQLSFSRESQEWCKNFAAYIEAKLKEKNA